MKILLLFFSLALVAPKQPTSIDRSITGDSQTRYMLGFIMEGGVVKLEGHLYTYVRMLPYASTSIQDRSYVFCDNRIDAFKAKGKFVVLTFDPVIHKNGCYDLFSVNTVVEPTPDFEVSPSGPLSLPNMR